MRAVLVGRGLVHDHPRPKLVQDGAIVRVRRAAVTRTDLEVNSGYRDYRGPLGEAFVGVVEDVVPGREMWLGARVVGELNYGCGGPTCKAFGEDHCPYRFVLGIAAMDCKWSPDGDAATGGSFADFVSLPIRNLHKVPDNVSDSDAVFCEFVAAAIRIHEQVHIVASDRVVVIGDGPFSFIIAQVMTWPGCEVTVIGKYPEKMALFAEQGLAVQEAREPWRHYADVVIDATGSPSGIQWALQHTRPKGTIVMKNTVRASGEELDLSQAVVDDISLIGSRSGPFEPAMRALASRRVVGEPFVSDEFELGDAVAAFERASTKGVRRVEIFMEPANQG